LKAKTLLKQQLDFQFDKRIEKSDRLFTRRSQNIVVKTVRFSM